MADKQFIKGAVTGVLCASLVLGGEAMLVSRKQVVQEVQCCRMWRLRRRLSIWKIL